MTDAKQEKLVKSVLAKAPGSEYSEISINKFLKKIVKVIDPIVSNEAFWRIFLEYEKSRLYQGNYIVLPNDDLAKP